MKFIDTHAHLYLPQFDNDHAEMMARTLAAGVEKIYLPAIDSETHERVLSFTAKYPEQCVPMMGLHPCSVQPNNFEKELEIVFEYWQKQDFCAVGEIGLDLHWDKTTLDIQKIAFKTQMEWAKLWNRPIVIHARQSMHEIMPMVKAANSDRLNGIFHCYSGNLEQARACIDMGFYLGIGGVLTYKNAGLANIVREIPLEHLVLETDAPYLTPLQHRGKRNESSYVPLIAAFLAEVKNCTIEEVAEITTRNAMAIFETRTPRNPTF